MILRHDVLKHGSIDHNVVSSLLKGHTENLLVLYGSRNIVRIHLKDAVIALLLRLQNLQCLVVIAGCNDAVRYLTLNQLRRAGITLVGKGDEIAKGAHAVRASCSCICTCKGSQLTHVCHPVDLRFDLRERKADGCSRGRYVLKRGRCRLSGRAL